MNIKYPEISVPLVGMDGNAFFIIGQVMKALRRGGVDQSEVELFRKEATAGDYNHLLSTVMDWVDTSGDDEEDEEDW